MTEIARMEEYLQDEELDEDQKQIIQQGDKELLDDLLYVLGQMFVEIIIIIIKIIIIEVFIFSVIGFHKWKWHSISRV